MPITMFQQRAGLFYNVCDYRAIGDGATDCTTFIAAAITAAVAAGGGIVFFPPGVFVTGTQTLNPKVNLLGSGMSATTLKLKNGANADLLSAQTSSINLSATLGTGANGTLYNFSIEGMTLDGNKANQTASPSYPLRFYGYGFILRDLAILNGYTGGLLIDWNGASLIAAPSDDMEATIDNIKTHDNNGIGFQIGGPHDTRMLNIISWRNGSHNFHLTPNTVGMLLTNCHGYYLPNTAGVYCYLIESGSVQCVNCVAEGSYYTNVAFLGNNNSWIGGSIFGTVSEWTNEVGIQLGQVAGATALPGQIYQSAGLQTAQSAHGCVINAQIIDCHGGAIKCVNEGNNLILANIYQSAGTILGGTTISSGGDTYMLNVSGLTADGTFGTGGGTGVTSNGSNTAFTVNDPVSGQVFQIDHYGNVYAKGGYNTSSGLYMTASNTPATLATGGTIASQGVPNLAVAPTADVTGIIMQAGYGGQVCIVTNASNFNITMAASGTSHVGPGTMCRISPNAACIFYYNGTTSLWEPTSYTVLPTQSLTAAAIATSGTITITDINVARLAPTAAVTGIIIPVGTYPGQPITVVNESVFPITMAASGTSNVADGAADTLAGLTSRIYIWDSGASLWYPVSDIPVQSPTAVAVATSGTISTVGIDVSRVAPTAAVTGVILASGTFGGQEVKVINESAFSVTFAASGTSHVADGVSDVIAATNARVFVWDTGTSLWYPCR